MAVRYVWLGRTNNRAQVVHITHTEDGSKPALCNEHPPEGWEWVGPNKPPDYNICGRCDDLLMKKVDGFGGGGRR